MAAVSSRGLVDYVSFPPLIGTVVSSELATLHELQSVYGVLDLYNFVELISVDGHNRRIVGAQRGNHH